METKVIVKSLLAGIVVLLLANSAAIGQEPGTALEDAGYTVGRPAGHEFLWDRFVANNPGLFSGGVQQNQKVADKELQPHSEIIEAAKRIGLVGKWIVLNIEKDGLFSKAKIGQQVNDVISIIPGPAESGPLAMG
jgi:hypothetical protein